MANTVMQMLRTTTANKVPNTTNLPNAGQLAMNMTDQVLYSRDTGTNIFAIGNNLPTMHVGNSTTSLLTVGNSSVNSLVVNTYISGNGYGITSVTATAAPGGANQQIQYNDSATTQGDANLTWDKDAAKFSVGNSTVNVTSNSTQLIVGNATGIAVTSASILVGNSSQNTFINSSAVLINGAAVGGAPGGSNTYIQFNDSTALGGDANLTWVKTSGILTVGNSTVNVNINSTSLDVGAINTTAIGLSLANNSITTGNSSINAIMNASTLSTSGPNFTVISTTTTAIPLTVKGAASATANLFAVGNNTTASQFVINSTGYAIGNGAGVTSVAAASALTANALNAGLTVKSFDVLSPIAGDTYTVFWTNAAITIAEIVVVLSNTAATAWANLGWFSGTSRITVAATINATANVANNTNGLHISGFTTAAVAANSYVWCNVGGLSNATEIFCAIKY